MNATLPQHEVPGQEVVKKTPFYDRPLKRIRLLNLDPLTWVCPCGQVNTTDLQECFVCAWPQGQH